LLLRGKLHPGLASRRHIYKTRPPRLRILDLCSGSGCISLLLFALLRKNFPRLRVLGYDISPKAIKLANENLTRNFETGETGNDDLLHRQVRFRKQDIFEDTEKLKKALDEDHIQFNLKKKHDDLENNESTTEVDIIISNPPYIAPNSFARTTSRSVRIFEPKLALVPPTHDKYGRYLAEMDDFFFFKRLMELHTELGSKILLMEVGGIAQAYAVAWLAVHKFQGNRIEIWRDHPDQVRTYKLRYSIQGCRVIKGKYIPIKGRGTVRAVVLFKEWGEKDAVSVDADGGSKVGNGEASED
jgi:methylase of polypeptide subunit release factors